MSQAKVSFGARAATVVYDPKRTSPEQVARGLTEYGYRSEALGERRKELVFALPGLQDFEERERLEREVVKFPGVVEASVDLLGKRARLVVETNLLSSKELLAYFRQRGLEPRLVGGKPE